MEEDKANIDNWTSYWVQILSCAHSTNRSTVINCALAPIIPALCGTFFGQLVAHLLDYHSPYKSINFVAWTFGGMFFGLAVGVWRTYSITRRSLTHTFWKVLHMTPVEGRQYAKDLYWSIPGYLCSYELAILMRQAFVAPPSARHSQQATASINTLL